MAKTCVLCGEKSGWLYRTTLMNGDQVCYGCLDRSGLTNSKIIEPEQMLEDSRCIKEISNMDSSKAIKKLKKLMEQREKISSEFQSFQTTKKVGSYFFVDENAKKWTTNKKNKIYDFSDILDFELIEDGYSIAKGGLGQAITGGILLGGVGAIIGGVVGKRTSTNVSETLVLKITVNDLSNPTENVSFIRNFKLHKNSPEYNRIASFAQECLSILQIICNENSTHKITPDTKNIALSIADEIRKLKELQKEGILTDIEFEEQKAKLLRK